jgi:hypothetical protein
MYHQHKEKEHSSVKDFLRTYLGFQLLQVASLIFFPLQLQSKSKEKVTQGL